MNAGSVGDAAAIQIHHLAGETVLDTVNALARADKAPLLPFGIGIVPQLDLGAIVGIVISNFHHFAVGGTDGVELVFRDHGLSHFLCGFLYSHCCFPPKRCSCIPCAVSLS